MIFETIADNTAVAVAPSFVALAVPPVSITNGVDVYPAPLAVTLIAVTLPLIVAVAVAKLDPVSGLPIVTVGGVLYPEPG